MSKASTHILQPLKQQAAHCFTTDAVRTGALSVFFTPVRYRVVKTVHSYSGVVLRTTKRTMIYPDSVTFLEVIALCPTI
jgi:hypothetical protein